jgi:hypothetical protein
MPQENPPKLYNRYSKAQIERHLQNEEAKGGVGRELSDLKLRYEGTIAYFKGSIAKVEAITRGKFDDDGDLVEDGIFATLTDPSPAPHIPFHPPERVQTEVSWDDFTPFLPPSKLYNFERKEIKSVLYLVRKPMRQNKYSMCQSIYAWWNPYENVPELQSRLRLGVGGVESIPLLRDPPAHLPFEEALDQVTKLEALARSFCDKYYIGLSINGVDPVIGYKNYGWCGVVTDNGVVELPAASHHLFEDLSNYVECRRV